MSIHDRVPMTDWREEELDIMSSSKATEKEKDRCIEKILNRRNNGKIIEVKENAKTSK